MATLTYVYQDSTAVLGPLSVAAEPHSYDLCAPHAERLTAPRGWEVVRLATEFIEAGPSSDDLLALADAVREAGRGRSGTGTAPRPRHLAGPEAEQADQTEVARRGHLRILRGEA